jgi:uncharacterized membrane protein YoaK (UPF0700 family)
MGAAVLALCAGMVNAIAILGFVHQGITHVTGNTSRLSIALFERDRQVITQTFLIIFSFFAGSVLAGFIIGDARLRMGRRYGFALAIQSMLLFVSTYGFSKGLLYGEYFASMAAGLQNAMASTYSEAIVRTTHMTGILTDIGALVGNRMRGIKADSRRIKLLSIILFSFLTGGFLAAYFYRHFKTQAMLVPAVIIGASAVGYEIFRRRSVGSQSAP